MQQSSPLQKGLDTTLMSSFKGTDKVQNKQIISSKTSGASSVIILTQDDSWAILGYFCLFFRSLGRGLSLWSSQLDARSSSSTRPLFVLENPLERFTNDLPRQQCLLKLEGRFIGDDINNTIIINYI